MNLLLDITVVIIIIAIIALCMGLYFNFQQNLSPKQKAALGYFICFSVGTYIISITLTTFLGIVKHHYEYLILIPFIIGRYSNYKHLKFYTFLQILAYLGSLAFLIYAKTH